MAERLNKEGYPTETQLRAREGGLVGRTRGVLKFLGRKIDDFLNPEYQRRWDTPPPRGTGITN